MIIFLGIMTTIELPFAKIRKMIYDQSIHATKVTMSPKYTVQSNEGFVLVELLLINFLLVEFRLVNFLLVGYLLEEFRSMYFLLVDYLLEAF